MGVAMSWSLMTRGLVSEDVELNASSFKPEGPDRWDDGWVPSPGVGDYSLLLLQRVRKLAKTVLPDKSKDRIWAGQSPAYSGDDNFYYHQKEQPKIGSK